MNTLGAFRVKVCGLTQAENIRAIKQLGVDFMGFMFYEQSKRFVGEDFKMPTFSNSKPKKVGVFVNEDEDQIIKMKEKHQLDMIQLHGDEAPEDCQFLFEKGIPVIKAFGIDSHFDFQCLSRYAPHCTYFLFDTKSDNYGGSGVCFDWNLLNRYKGKTPFFLSGGLNPNSLESLLSFHHPNCIGVDLNSGFESKAGIKDFDLLKPFLYSIQYETD